MQVTQCDRCGELPIEVFAESETGVHDSGSEWGVSIQVITKARSRPDLCRRCFWILVDEAIDTIKEPA